MTLLVPYRDRKEHFKQFIPAMEEHDICIIEQVDNKPFNRGKLINVGFIETDAIRFCAHDIDMIDSKVVYYKQVYPMNAVVQLAKSDIQKIDYLGGATIFTNATFNYVGGYHNDFWHRAEDNEMSFNLKRKHVPVINRFGVFRQLPHERPEIEFDSLLWLKAQLPRAKDMLKTCEYKLISKEVKDGYTHLKVEL